MTGLAEAVEDAQSGNIKLYRRTVTIIPVKEYQLLSMMKMDEELTEKFPFVSEVSQ